MIFRFKSLSLKDREQILDVTQETGVLQKDNTSKKLFEINLDCMGGAHIALSCQVIN